MGNARFLVQRVLNMNYGAMFDTVSAIHHKTGRSRWTIFQDMRQCAVKYGAGYVDYNLFEMWSLTPELRDTYLTRGRNNEVVVKYNSKAAMDELDDKAKFNARFSDFLHRDWVPVTGENRDEVMAFLSRHSTFMSKPTHGCCGRGIEKLNTADFPSPDALYDRLLEQAPQLELEEVITQHPALDAIYPGSINTARIVTIRGKEGKVYFVAALLRIGNGKFVDNFDNGGMLAPVDLETGAIQAVAIDKYKNVYEKHPATGTSIKCCVIPDWDKAKELVTQAAPLIPDVRYVGWDVCFTPDGPCLVEGNQYPAHDLYQHPVQTPDRVGIMPRFRAIEAEEEQLKKQ